MHDSVEDTGLGQDVNGGQSCTTHLCSSAAVKKICMYWFRSMEEGGLGQYAIAGQSCPAHTAPWPQKKTELHVNGGSSPDLPDLDFFEWSSCFLTHLALHYTSDASLTWQCVAFSKAAAAAVHYFQWSLSSGRSLARERASSHLEQHENAKMLHQRTVWRAPVDLFGTLDAFGRVRHGTLGGGGHVKLKLN